MITDNELQARLNAQKAPHVTKLYIESRILNVRYLRVSESETLTICIIMLDNHYSVRGESACVDPANYDKEIGEKLAYEDAFRKLWPLFGFLLAEKLHQMSHP
jgi:hypothetical protein